MKFDRQFLELSNDDRSMQRTIRTDEAAFKTTYLSLLLIACTTVFPHTTLSLRSALRAEDHRIQNLLRDPSMA